MKKTVLLAFILMLLASAVAGTLLIDFGTANPTVFFISPKNNKVYAVNNVPLIFTVNYDSRLYYTISFYALIKYRLDGELKGKIEPELTPDSPKETFSVNLTALSDGIHSVTVSAYGDYYTILGNSSDSFFGIVYFTVDTTPPRISIRAPLDRTYNATDVPLNFIVREPVSWMGYSLDAQANVTISGNTTLSELSYGSHNLTVYATDTAGNTGASETIYFTAIPPDLRYDIELFPQWAAWAVAVSVMTVMIVAVAGAILLVYFAKVKKTIGKAEKQQDSYRYFRMHGFFTKMGASGSTRSFHFSNIWPVIRLLH
jgi:hypothetical protein